MASGKRASMREGPLADLFRNTDSDGVGGEPREKDDVRREPVEREPDPRALPPEGAQGAPRGERSSRSELRPRQPERQPDPPRPPARSRYEGVPTPEERLRSVFSPDIPENVMDRAPEPRYEERQPIHQPSSAQQHDPVLRVVGVGGAGVNAVNRMIEAQVEGVEFIAVNTDVQSLEQSAAGTRVHIGHNSTRGLGSGADPSLGRQSAIESYDELKGLL